SLALAMRLKQRYPDQVVCFGGANCEGDMGVALHRSFPWIDYVCSGEGDLAFPELVRALRASPGGGQTGLQIDGIISRDGAETKRPAEMTKPVKNLDLLPYPDFE